MANPITHVHFAGEVLNALPPSARAAAEQHADAFRFGGVGPDFLFSLRELGDPAARYCNVMQYNYMYEVFSEIKSYLKKTGDAVALSYTLGLLTHYVLDQTIHPFVNHFVENEMGEQLPTEQQAGIHTLIETTLDEYLIREEMGYKNGKGYSFNRAANPKRKTRRAVGKLYYNAVNKHVGFHPSAGRIRLAIRVTMLSMRAFSWLSPLRNSIGKKEEKNLASGKKKVRNMLRPPEYYGEVDFLNLKRLPYRIVRNRPETAEKSALDILAESKPLAVTYIEEFLTALNNDTPLDPAKFAVNYEGVDIRII